MAVTTENGVTTIRPTAWKWYLGAAAMVWLFPIGTIVAAFFALTATGLFQNLRLTPEGLELRNYMSRKVYRWNEIGDFRTYKIRSGFITAANMVSFTHVNQEGTLLGKAAKMLAGGTHSIPALGLPPKDLASLMMRYQQGAIPADTAEHAPAAPGTPVRRPRAVPVPAAGPGRQPASNAKAAPAAFGRKAAVPAPVGSSARPLIEDGGWRRRPANRPPFG